MSQRTNKKSRIVEVIEYYIENKEFPGKEWIKELAERHEVSVYTIREDIRKAKEGNLGEKVLDILNTRLNDAVTDMETWKNSDLIKLYQATRPKQVETKIDAKIELDIRGNAIGDALRVLDAIKKREHLHE